MVFVIWVTEACNMKCRYCYEGIEKAMAFMSPDTAHHLTGWIIRQLQERGSKEAQIRFHGGEPMLNFEVVRQIVSEFMQYREYSFYFQLTTNALHLNEEQMRFLGTHINELSVSMDGAAETHNANRITHDGKDTFDAVYANACVLKKIAPQTAVRMTVTPEMCGSFAENVFFLIKNGFNDIMSSIDLFNGDWTEEHLDLLEEQCGMIEDCISSSFPENQISFGSPVYASVKRRKCGGGIDAFNISCSGALYPCTYAVGEPQFQCGDIFSGIDTTKIEEFQHIYEHPVSACEGCGAYDVCTTVRCKYLNYACLGDLYTPTAVICSLNRRSVQHYMRRQQ